MVWTKTSCPHNIDAEPPETQLFTATSWFGVRVRILRHPAIRRSQARVSIERVSPYREEWMARILVIELTFKNGNIFHNLNSTAGGRQKDIFLHLYGSFSTSQILCGETVQRHG